MVFTQGLQQNGGFDISLLLDIIHRADRHVVQISGSCTVIMCRTNNQDRRRDLYTTSGTTLNLRPAMMSGNTTGPCPVDLTAVEAGN